MNKKWIIRQPIDRTTVEQFRSDLKRGIDTYDKAEHFFRPKLEDLHNPFLMKNMEEAVVRLNKAIERNEKILLFGDYDVDGTTAVALMYSFLSGYSNKLDYYIPDRYTEGYGLSRKGALCERNEWKLEELYKLLDFVAVAIGADIVPVTGENRILAHNGMRLLNEFPRISFKRLLTLAKRSFPVTLTDIVFTIAPRINSAGRLYSGRQAVELMITEDESRIEELAQSIDNYNQERRDLDESTTNEALEILASDKWYEHSKSTVVFHESWHKGVVGIVASRLIENHFKPTIVLTENEGKLTGSARTINNFDIYNALLSCEDLLEQFGGHTFAAGLTLRKENFETFKARFDSVVKETLTLEDELPNEFIDLELNFNEIYERQENRMLIPRLKRILKQMEPHGPGNMKPVFYTRNVYSKNIRILKEKHLKLQVTQPDADVVLDAIGFGLAHKEYEVAEGVPFEMIYTLESNLWNGRESLQLNIKDIRVMI
ncbi:putative single-stranded-DNA-specific exonuclease RecJ [Ancylostoma ceylanicum]|uniref:Single-stranded-DNA-specific exonuclease RecJ n=1 Tax=Ancylostoma ceylanicum TaxID=53326 RepID=A0A0D6LDT5_9BILA|nr:putative single-stranded-DNA-specific exonuclease RecJ [Ancylostoma ceylanicum]